MCISGRRWKRCGRGTGGTVSVIGLIILADFWLLFWFLNCNKVEKTLKEILEEIKKRGNDI